MARKLRLLYPGAIHHVWAHSLPDTPLFPDESEAEIFCELFAGVLERLEWSCLAWCLMGTHYHLLVRTLRPDLDIGMKRLNGCYAQGFNRRRGRRGHLFQDRYGSRHVTTDAYFRWVVRYVFRNPVEAGLCRDPIDWRWSSFRQTVVDAGLGEIPTTELLRYLGSGERLAAFVRGGRP